MNKGKPTEYQQALIEKLLSRNFPGAEDLRGQLTEYETEGYDDPDGCGSFAIYPDKSMQPAGVEHTIPVEGLARDGKGMPVEYLLHVDDGYANELEVVVYSGKRLDSPISVDDIRAMTRAERIEYEDKERGTL